MGLQGAHRLQGNSCSGRSAPDVWSAQVCSGWTAWAMSLSRLVRCREGCPRGAKLVDSTNPAGEPGFFEWGGPAARTCNIHHRDSWAYPTSLKVQTQAQWRSNAFLGA